MTIKKTLPCLLNAVILILLVLMLFIQPSSSGRLHHQTNMAGSRAKATSIEVARYRNEADSVGRVEDSARRVPTGPDPLHHNNHPIRP